MCTTTDNDIKLSFCIFIQTTLFPIEQFEDILSFIHHTKKYLLKK